MILMFVRNCLDWIQDTFHWVLLKLKDTLAKIALTAFIVIILLWLSIFLYGVFYFAYVPPASYVKPIHLEFRVCEDGIFMCSFPTANISLLKQGQDEVFMKGQSYKILFEFEIPESPTNKQLGMFMVNLQLYNSKGGIVKSSARSAILHYRSELLRILDTLTFAPLLLFGYSEQKQLITTEFFSNYLDDAYNPAVGAVIQVQSMKIELYSSVLKIYATFSGIRYFMFHWPLLSSIVGITMNMTFLSFIALLSWYQCMGSNQKDDTDLSWTDRGTSSLEERRQYVRQMLKRERQRGAEYIDNGSTDRQVSSSDDNDMVTETIGGATGGPENDGEETVIYKSMPECDTELRLRHSITVKQT